MPQPTTQVMSRMNQWCVEHHGPSGLTAAVAESSVTMREAELQVLEFVRQHVKPQEGIVAGSTVHVDVAFLKVRGLRRRGGGGGVRKVEKDNPTKKHVRKTMV